MQTPSGKSSAKSSAKSPISACSNANRAAVSSDAVYTPEKVPVLVKVETKAATTHDRLVVFDANKAARIALEKLSPNPNTVKDAGVAEFQFSPQKQGKYSLEFWPGGSESTDAAKLTVFCGITPAPSFDRALSSADKTKSSASKSTKPDAGDSKREPAGAAEVAGVLEGASAFSKEQRAKIAEKLRSLVMGFLDAKDSGELKQSLPIDLSKEFGALGFALSQTSKQIEGAKKQPSTTTGDDEDEEEEDETDRFVRELNSIVMSDWGVHKSNVVGDADFSIEVKRNEANRASIHVKSNKKNRPELRARILGTWTPATASNDSSFAANKPEFKRQPSVISTELPSTGRVSLSLLFALALGVAGSAAHTWWLFGTNLRAAGWQGWLPMLFAVLVWSCQQLVRRLVLIKHAWQAFQSDRKEHADRHEWSFEDVGHSLTSIWREPYERMELWTREKASGFPAHLATVFFACLLLHASLTVAGVRSSSATAAAASAATQRNFDASQTHPSSLSAPAQPSATAVVACDLVNRLMLTASCALLVWTLKLASDISELMVRQQTLVSELHRRIKDVIRERARELQDGSSSSTRRGEAKGSNDFLTVTALYSVDVNDCELYLRTLDRGFSLNFLGLGHALVLNRSLLLKAAGLTWTLLLFVWRVPAAGLVPFTSDGPIGWFVVSMLCSLWPVSVTVLMFLRFLAFEKLGVGARASD